MHNETNTSLNAIQVVCRQIYEHKVPIKNFLYRWQRVRNMNRHLLTVNYLWRLSILQNKPDHFFEILSFVSVHAYKPSRMQTYTDPIRYYHFLPPLSRAWPSTCIVCENHQRFLFSFFFMALQNNKMPNSSLDKSGQAIFKLYTELTEEQMLKADKKCFSFNYYL